MNQGERQDGLPSKTKQIKKPARQKTSYPYSFDLIGDGGFPTETDVIKNKKRVGLQVNNGALRYIKNSLKPQRLKDNVMAQNQYSLNRKQANVMNAKNHIKMFPQWALQQQKQKPTMESYHRIIAKQWKNADSQSLKKMNEYFPKNYVWKNDKWTGSEIVKIVKKQKTLYPNKLARYKQNQGFQSLALTRDQLINHVPLLVRQIVEANQQLSTSGFGPISKQGLPLYAGRWFDRQSGRMKLLPKAKLAFVNPLDRNQKIAYLQARLINHWNQYVKMAQQYQKVKLMSDQQYTSKVSKRIVNSYNNIYDTQKFIAKIVKIMKNYLAVESFRKKSSRQLIMNQIISNYSNLVKPLMNNIPSQDAPQSQRKQWVFQWDQIVKNALYQALSTFKNEVDAGLIPQVTNPAQFIQQAGNISLSAAGLMYNNVKRLIPILNKIWVMAIVPNKMTSKQFTQIVQNRQQLKRRLSTISKYGYQQLDAFQKILDPIIQNLADSPTELLATPDYRQYLTGYQQLMQTLPKQVDRQLIDYKNTQNIIRDQRQKFRGYSRAKQTKSSDSILQTVFSYKILNYFYYTAIGYQTTIGNFFFNAFWTGFNLRANFLAQADFINSLKKNNGMVLDALKLPQSILNQIYQFVKTENLQLINYPNVIPKFNSIITLRILKTITSVTRIQAANVRQSGGMIVPLIQLLRTYGTAQYRKYCVMFLEHGIQNLYIPGLEQQYKQLRASLQPKEKNTINIQKPQFQRSIMKMEEKVENIPNNQVITIDKFIDEIDTQNPYADLYPSFQQDELNNNRITPYKPTLIKKPEQQRRMVPYKSVLNTNIMKSQQNDVVALVGDKELTQYFFNQTGYANPISDYDQESIKHFKEIFGPEKIKYYTMRDFIANRAGLRDLQTQLASADGVFKDRTGKQVKYKQQAIKNFIKAVDERMQNMPSEQFYIKTLTEGFTVNPFITSALVQKLKAQSL